MKGNSIIAVLLLLVSAGVSFGVTKLSVPAAQPDVQVGSVAGPDFFGPYFSVNGVHDYKAQASLSTATTTVCAFQSPNATSTLRAAVIRFKVSTTTASSLTIAYGTSRTVNTTTIGSAYAIGANAQATIEASSTQGTAGQVGVFPPNTWVNFLMSGGTGTYSPVGSCEAVFMTV